MVPYLEFRRPFDGVPNLPVPSARGSHILAGNALDALSILSLHLVPAIRRGCAVVSTGTVTTSIPKWIETWNPGRIFCAWDATTNGDHDAPV